MNTITIFSGSHKPAVESAAVYKGTFEIAGDYTLRRDLTQLMTSEVEVIDKNNVIQAQDIILFGYENTIRFGKVFDIEKNYDTAKIYFTYGIDSHQMELPWFLATQNLDNRPYFDNRQDLQIEVEKYASGSLRITAPDNYLGLDTALRQFARRGHLAEQYSLEYNSLGEISRFLIRLTDENVGGYGINRWSVPMEPIKIRLDDPYVQKSYLLKIGTDKMTRLRLYNQDNRTQWVDYQLLNDGSIVANTTTATTPWTKEFTYETAVNANAVMPQRFFIKDDQSDLYNSLNYAKDIFYQSEYDNEIEIELPANNPHFTLSTYDRDGRIYTRGFETIDTLLGRTTYVYLPNSSVSIKTIVSGYEINRGVMKIIFGLSRSRLTDVINNFINKDNI